MKGSPAIAATAAALFCLHPAGAVSQELDETEQAMSEWVDAHAKESIALLEELVNIDGGTLNPDGVREVGRVLERELEAIGLEARWIELPPETLRAGHLVGTQEGAKGPKYS